MKKEDDLVNDIAEFIYSCGWGYKFLFFGKKIKVKGETKLESELKITGDDADQFLSAFSKRFKVDISSFDVNKYFLEERDPVLKIFDKIFFKQRKEREITVRDLARSALIGKLDDEVLLR